MKEEEVPINDPGDEKDLVEKKPFMTKQKKLLICLFIALAVLVIYFIIISSKVKNDKDKTKEKEKPVPGPEIDKEILGRIYTIYNLEKDEETNIFYSKFEIPVIYSIYIDGERVANTAKQELGKGEHNITYVIYEDFNMRNMFYDIANLISVEMISDKKCKIIGIESAFEKCKDLESFSIKGFDTSLSKRHYKPPVRIISPPLKFQNNLVLF